MRKSDVKMYVLYSYPVQSSLFWHWIFNKRLEERKWPRDFI